MTSSIVYVTILLCSLALPAIAQVWQFRLSGNGATNRKGRLEIKIGDDPWGTVCNDGFDNNDAVVACRSLGIDGGANFDANAQATYGVPPSSVKPVRNVFECKGNEQSLDGCISADATGCTNQEDIAVECLGVIQVPATTVKPDFATLPPVTCDNNHQTIRLVDGSGATEGRVEIKYKNEWGTICDDFWDQNDAKVICRMLCDSTANAQAIIRSQFASAPATTKIHLNGLRCKGTENQIDQCPHWGWANTTTCTHKKDAGVICAPPGTLPANPLQPAITCTQNSIRAKLDKSKYPNLKIADLSLTDPGSNCDMKKSEDAQSITMEIPYVGCNTKKTFNATHINYGNTVLRSLPSTTGLVTRESQYTVAVVCEVRRDKADSSKLDPIMIVAPPVSSNTTFNVQMFVFDPVTNKKLALPARTPLGSFIGIGVELTTNDPSLKIVVPTCFASPDLTVTANSKQYPLVQDKCIKDQTVTIRVVDQKTIGFTFELFMFVDGTKPEVDLYIHCTGLVCGENEGGATCDQTCGARRRRDTRVERHRRGLSAGLAIVEGVEGPFHMEVTDDMKTAIEQGILRKLHVGVEERPEEEPRSVHEQEKNIPEQHASSAENVSVFLSQLVGLLLAALITVWLN